MSTASTRREIAPTDYNFRFRDCLIGAQMLFVAFGALVLVPLLTGLDSNVALFTAGVGTLLFQVCTRGKVPIFLASSFAFIAPIIYGVQTWGMAQTLGGLVCSGLVYFLLSGLIRWRGTDVVLRVLPPIVTGPVIMVIGLILAPVAVHMALGKTGDGAVVLVPENTALWISMTSLAVTVLVSLLGKGFLRLMPILCGIAAGFIVSMFFGVGDWTKVAATPWLQMPSFTFPEFAWEPILFIMPITLAPAIEHFGDVVAISSITGRDYLKDPGVHATMFGDGVATMAAGFVGGPPCTTYAEVIGAVSLTRVFNPAVMTWAAMCAILSELNRQGRLTIVEAFDVDATSTKALITKLAGLEVGKRPLIVTEEASEHLYLSARNLPYVQVRDVQGLDPVALVGADTVVITADAVKKVEEWLA